MSKKILELNLQTKINKFFKRENYDKLSRTEKPLEELILQTHMPVSLAPVAPIAGS